MKPKHFSLAVLGSLILLVGSTSPVFAKDNNNNNNNHGFSFHFDFGRFFRRDDKKDKHDDRHDDRDDRGHKKHEKHSGSTLVTGTVYDGNHDPVSGGTIVVHCGSATKTVSIGDDGQYSAKFSKAECKSGDTANATANTSKGSGSGSSTVQDSGDDSFDCDLDLAVIDITVPEFGLVGGAVTSVASAAGYVFLKKKN